MRKALAAVATGLLIGLPMLGTPAFANIVANPGFETETGNAPWSPPDSWSIQAVTDPQIGSITDVGADSSFPNNGLNNAYLGDGTLYQALSTTNGTTYNVSFWLAVNDATTYSDPGATFDASIGGTDLVGGTPISPVALTLGTYMEFTDTFTATSSTSTISFTGMTTGDDGIWYVDDVSVDAQTSTATPEPSAFLLVGSALAMITLVRLRRRA